MYPCAVPSRSVFSHVRLFVTPWTRAHQYPLPIGFFRQEYWSGLPSPPPGDFPTQGSNPGLPHCRQTLYQLNHRGSPGPVECQIKQFLCVFSLCPVPLVSLQALLAPSFSFQFSFFFLPLPADRRNKTYHQMTEKRHQSVSSVT